MAHVEIVIVVGFEPVVGLSDQFFQRLAFVVAGDCFVQMPPDALDGICLRSIGRQEVEHDPVARCVRYSCTARLLWKAALSQITLTFFQPRKRRRRSSR